MSSRKPYTRKAKRSNQPFKIRCPELLKDYLSSAKNGSIPTFKFDPPEALPTVLYTLKPECRALEGFIASDVICLDFQAVRMSPKDTKEYIMARIENGVEIVVGDSHGLFNFFGCSNSQIKARKALLVKRSVPEIEMLKDKMGDFSRLPSVGKQMKRMGLLFSTSYRIGELPIGRKSEAHPGWN